MLFDIHKVYTIYDYGSEGQMVVEIQKDETEQVDITAGRRNELLGAVEGSKADYTEQPLKLVDDNGGFRYSVNVKEPTAFYIYLESGYILDQLQVNPKEVDQDLLLQDFTSDSKLIFCFFVSSTTQFTVRGRKIRDATIRKKLLQSPKDIFLRRVLIERCSLDYKSQLLQNKEFLTLDEIASYLSLNKRTIQNKVGQGKFLKPKKPGGTVVWDKEEFLEWCRRQ